MSLTSNSVLNEFFAAAKNLNTEYKALSAKHSVLDQVINDILHSVEFGKNSAIDMVTLYKLLKDTLQQRRATKNHITLIIATRERLQISDKCLKQTQQRICQITSQQGNAAYQPRVLTELKY